MHTGIEIIITPEDTDAIKAFTGWIGTVSKRAQSGFCRQNKHMDNEVLMDELPDESLMREDHDLNRVAQQIGTLADLFAFEEERLSAAFSQLPLLRQRILVLLFVEEMKPAEVARLLNCSPAYVYEQLYRAKKRLRDLLDAGELL